MKPFLKFILLASIMINISCSDTLVCGKSWTLKQNSQINPSLSSELNNIRDSYLKSIIEKRYNDSNLFFAENLKSNLAGIGQFYDMANIVLKSSKASVQDNFYFRRKIMATASEKTPIIEFKDNETNLNLSLDPITLVTEHTYITLQKFTAPQIDYLLSFIYVKENNTWKIAVFRIDIISVLQMNSENWMKIAESYISNGEILTSYLCSTISDHTAKPSPIVHYINDKQLKDSHDKIKKILNLPYVIDSIKSKPEFFNVFINFENGPKPIIAYKSNISIKNTTQIKNESREIKKYFLKTNPSMNKYFKSIQFDVFNKIPLETDIKNDYITVSDNL